MRKSRIHRHTNWDKALKTRILKTYFCSVKLPPPNVDNLLTLQGAHLLTLKRPKRGQTNNYPEYIYIYIYIRERERERERERKNDILRERQSKGGVLGSDSKVSPQWRQSLRNSYAIVQRLRSYYAIVAPRNLEQVREVPGNQLFIGTTLEVNRTTHTHTPFNFFELIVLHFRVFKLHVRSGCNGQAVANVM